MAVHRLLRDRTVFVGEVERARIELVNLLAIFGADRDRHRPGGQVERLAAQRRAGDPALEHIVVSAGRRQIHARFGADRVQTENADRHAAEGLDAADDVAVRVDDRVEAEAEAGLRDLPVDRRVGAIALILEESVPPPIAAEHVEIAAQPARQIVGGTLIGIVARAELVGAAARPHHLGGAVTVRIEDMGVVEKELPHGRRKARARRIIGDEKRRGRRAGGERREGIRRLLERVARIDEIGFGIGFHARRQLIMRDA